MRGEIDLAPVVEADPVEMAEVAAAEVETIDAEPIEADPVEVAAPAPALQASIGRILSANMEAIR